MKIIKTVKAMQKLSDSLRMEGKSIGLVPTMGALHDGHLSLINMCAKVSDVTVVSIFVNKLQFAPSEDFDSYPKQLKKDKDAAQASGADYIFAPENDGLYSDDFSSFVRVEGLTENLCGASRPDHFKGVTTVVAKLFNIVKPHKAFFGEKDFQQLVVIKRMVRDLNIDVRIYGGKIIREKDGLALSSRNAYLSSKERKKATALFRALKDSERLYKGGEKSAFKIRENVVGLVKAVGFNIDYVKVVDIDTLEDVKSVNADVLLAVAAEIGGVRLIDNIKLKV